MKNYEAIGKLVSYINNGYSETDCLAMGYNQTERGPSMGRSLYGKSYGFVRR